MIIDHKNRPEKWYTELARIIGILQVKGRLKPEEARCLLDIIDLVIIQQDLELFYILEEFTEHESVPETYEIDEIIKATLVATNLKQPESIKQLKAVVQELVRERTRIQNKQREDENEYLV